MVGVQAVLFYLVAYLFMNLGAFAVVAFLRNETGSEDLDRMRGLVRRSPWMVVTLSLFLLSLLGMPPLVGFTAKFQIFSPLWSAGVYYAHAGDARPGVHATGPAGGRRRQHRLQRGVLSESDAGDDYRGAGRGPGRSSAVPAAGTGRAGGVRRGHGRGGDRAGRPVEPAGRRDPPRRRSVHPTAGDGGRVAPGPSAPVVAGRPGGGGLPPGPGGEEENRP